MYYEVTLLNDSETDASATIVWAKDTFYVQSHNKKMEETLKMILSKDAYILSPGVNKDNYSSDGVLFVQLGTPYYFEVIPQILAWRGYNAVFHGEKSIMNIIPGFTLKAAGEDISYNDKGERIVNRVPHGFVAINEAAGKYLVGGQWLGANIDKLDAVWVLEENPYQDYSEEDRAAEWKQMGKGSKEFHPGADPDRYKEENERVAGELKKKLKNGLEKLKYKASDKAKKLQEMFPKEEKPKHPGRSVASFTAAIPERSSVIFSPTLKIAFDSELYEKILGSGELPAGFQNANDWQFIPYPPTKANPNGERYSDEMRASSPFNPRNKKNVDPRLLIGLEEGAVLDADIHVEGARWEDKAKPLELERIGGDEQIQVNKLPDLKLSLEDTPEDAKKRHTVGMRLRGFLAQMKGIKRTGANRGEAIYRPEKAAQIKIPNVYLPGDKDIPAGAHIFHGNFDNGREYQRGLIAAMLEPSQYEKFGGPVGMHGHFLNSPYGSGKTPMSLAWLSGLRNTVIDGKRAFKVGEQTAFIVAPAKNIMSWKGQANNFLGEQPVVISGDRAQRIRMWNDLIDMAKEGRLPSTVVISSSAFRMEGEDEDSPGAGLGVPEGIPSMDAQMMRVLMAGGTAFGKEVKGKHVAAMVIDESAQFSNYSTSRQKVLRTMLDDLYQSGGLNVTLNGDLSGNSAADTVSEVAFTNARARQHMVTLKTKYTKPIQEVTVTTPFLGEKKSKTKGDRRHCWRTRDSARELRDAFGVNVSVVTSEFIAGDRAGLYYTPDIIADMGKVWGGIYSKTLRTMSAIMTTTDPTVRSRGMGMISILFGVSYGAVHPARLFDYDTGVEDLLNTLSQNKKVTPEILERIKKKIKAYQYGDAEMGIPRLCGWNPTDSINQVMLPDSGRYNAEARNAIYKQLFEDDKSGDADFIEEALMSWDCPAVDEIVDGVAEELATKRKAKDGNVRLGIGGFSNRAIERIYKTLQKKHPGLEINMVHGGLSSAEVAEVERRHNETTDRDVITLVTSAAKYGLNLKAQRSWRFPTWNPATGKQVTGRSHRDPLQEHIATIVGVGGLVAYMQYVANEKSKIAEDAGEGFSDEDMEALESGDGIDEMNFKPGFFTSFLGALSPLNPEFTPHIRDKESGKMSAAELKQYKKHSAERRKTGLEETKARRAEALARAEEEEKAQEKARRQEAAKQRQKSKEQAKKSSTKPTSDKAAAKKNAGVAPAMPKVPSTKKSFSRPTFTRNPLYEGNQ